MFSWTRDGILYILAIAKIKKIGIITRTDGSYTWQHLGFPCGKNRKMSMVNYNGFIQACINHF